MTTEVLTFPTASGQRLSARLELPPDLEPCAYALFAHCFTCTKNIRAAVQISRELALAGIATLRFDFTGLGESEGDFADTNFSSNVDDLVAAAAYLAEEYEAPRILVGHSLGGSAVIAAASRLPSVRAVATVGAPCEAAHVVSHFADRRAEIEERGKVEISLAGRPFTIRKDFVRDIEATRMEQKIAALDRALLVMHSPVDKIVGIENAQYIYQTARHPKSFVSIDGADHLLTRESDARYVGRVIATWAGRYLDAASRSGVDAGWTVVHTGRAGYASPVTTGRHRLVSDEPESLGGADLGPSPYDLLNAALGACTGMTLRMYADRKKWPLEGVAVHLHHDTIHAHDCQACETEEGHVDHVVRKILLSGPLTDQQKSRLLEIADRCPVHRTLRSEVDIHTELQT